MIYSVVSLLESCILCFPGQCAHCFSCFLCSITLQDIVWYADDAYPDMSKLTATSSLPQPPGIILFLFSCASLSVNFPNPDKTKRESKHCIILVQSYMASNMAYSILKNSFFLKRLMFFQTPSDSQQCFHFSSVVCSLPFYVAFCTLLHSGVGKLLTHIFFQSGGVFPGPDHYRRRGAPAQPRHADVRGGLVPPVAARLPEGAGRRGLVHPAEQDVCPSALPAFSCRSMEIIGSSFDTCWVVRFWRMDGWVGATGRCVMRVQLGIF